MPSPSELIKERLDIVEFLRGYLELTPAGRNFKALCPFHREKTPSFMISSERQSWHCFGCASGGDIFGFLMRYENVEFGEALRILAERTGVELRRINPAEHKFAGLLYEINDAAKRFFTAQLQDSAAAQEYLKKRGLHAETIREFEVGFAPNQPEALFLHLVNQGYAPDDILRAGLSIKTDRGMRFDRFRGRVMFPIHNHFGKTVGFTGRVLPQFEREDVAKYVNSSESPIFSKSKLLYGYWKTKNHIRESGKAFVVEGQMDFLMSWQVGARNAVASSGTALTADHLRVLRRLTDELVISFDNDEAGREAGERAIDLAESNDFAVRVVVFEDKDPAEAAVRDPHAFMQSVREARPAMEFYFEKYLGGFDKKRYSRESLRKLRGVLRKIRNTASAVARDYWMKELAKRTAIDERALIEEAEQLPVAAQHDTGQPEPEGPEKFSRWELLSERLLSYASTKNSFAVLEDCAAQLAPLYQQILAILKRGERRAEDALLDERLHLILLRSEEFVEHDAEEMKEQLAREYFKERRRDLTSRVREAEKIGDEEALRMVLKEFQQLPVF